MDFLSDLINRFRKSPQQLTGQGIARQGAEVLADRPYQLYMQETKQMGEQPMSYEQWKAQQMQQQEQPSGIQPVRY